MEYLASHFSVFPLTMLTEALHSGEIPEGAMAITIDDGYRDNYLNAFPILQRFSLPATIFLATDAIGSGRVLWHDRVFSAFRETNVPIFADAEHGLGPYPLRTIEEKLIAQREVLKFLSCLDDSSRYSWIDRLIENLRVEDRKIVAGLMLSWNEVAEMQKSNITFGSHTVTHPILSRIAAERVKEEIVESKRVLEDRLGTRITAFAYPVGQKGTFDESVKKYLREAGYTCALTSIFGSNSAGDDLFELRRGKPWEEHLPMFAAKLHWYRFWC